MMRHCTWCIYCSFLLSKGQVLTVHSHWLCAQLQLIFLAVAFVAESMSWLLPQPKRQRQLYCPIATKIIGFNKPLKWLVKQRGAPAPVVIMLSAITDFIREAIDDGASTLTVVKMSGNYYLHCSTAWTLFMDQRKHKTYCAKAQWWFSQNISCCDPLMVFDPPDLM